MANFFHTFTIHKLYLFSSRISTSSFDVKDAISIGHPLVWDYLMGHLIDVTFDISKAFDGFNILIFFTNANLTEFLAGLVALVLYEEKWMDQFFKKYNFF